MDRLDHEKTEDSCECTCLCAVCRWLLLLDCLLAVGVNLCILAFLRYLSALLLLFAAYFKVSHVPTNVQPSHSH